MIRLATALLVLVLLPHTGCAARGGDPGAGEPIRLTVLTYNIHHGEGMDKKLDLQRIANVIRACEADLVALQEVDQGTKRTASADQPAELARMLKMEVAYGPAMDFQGGKYGDAVLSRLPITSSRAVALPWTPSGQREPRVALAARCRLPHGAELLFISTHYDHTGESPDRLPQAQATNAELAKDDSLAILAGDFNCESGSPPMEELARRWTIVTDGNPAKTCPADKPRIKIDHVLVKPSNRWRVIEARVIDEPVASDHRPVLVKLELAD